ncbi:MAG: VanZ family protein [Phycisphaera sp.]|nr:VanZ family protein [Phycisphaera sp.]
MTQLIPSPLSDGANRLNPDSPQRWSAHWRRTAAILAILVLLIGTHIPRLAIGTPEDGPDKLLHFFAFAAITTLLRISSLGRSSLRTGILAMSLAILDEVTQELPGLNRSFDHLDLVADASGIVLALAWCKALGPLQRGSFNHRLREVRTFAALRLLLASPMNWIHIATAGVLGAMIGGVLLGIGGRNPVIGPITMIVVGAMAGFVAAAVIVVEAGRRFSLGRIDRDRRCLRCLDPTPEGGECLVCGGRHRSSPHTPGVPARRVALRITLFVLLLALAGVGVYVALLGSVPGSVHSLPMLRGALSWYGSIQVSMSMTLDAVFLGIPAALLVWRSRRKMALKSELEGIRCLSCGHDLQGIATGGIAGRCPECGEEFQGDRPGEMAVSLEQGENDGR